MNGISRRDRFLVMVRVLLRGAAVVAVHQARSTGWAAGSEVAFAAFRARSERSILDIVERQDDGAHSLSLSGRSVSICRQGSPTGRRAEGHTTVSTRRKDIHAKPQAMKTLEPEKSAAAPGAQRGEVNIRYLKQKRLWQRTRAEEPSRRRRPTPVLGSSRMQTEKESTADSVGAR